MPGTVIGTGERQNPCLLVAQNPAQSRRVTEGSRAGPGIRWDTGQHEGGSELKADGLTERNGSKQRGWPLAGFPEQTCKHQRAQPFRILQLVPYSWSRNFAFQKTKKKKKQLIEMGFACPSKDLGLCPKGYGLLINHSKQRSDGSLLYP